MGEAAEKGYTQCTGEFDVVYVQQGEGVAQQQLCLLETVG